MIVDQDGRAVPSSSRIFEIADEFAFFTVYADDGVMPALKGSSNLGDVFKLLITIRARVGWKHLVVDPKRVAHLAKQAGDCVGRNEDPQF
jgi:hypothetical protein